LHREKYTAAEHGNWTLGGRYFCMTAETWQRLVASRQYLFKTWDGKDREQGPENLDQG